MAIDYGLITSLDELKGFLKYLTDLGQPIGYDVETGYSGEPRNKGAVDVFWDNQFVCGFSLSSLDVARYIPVAHDLGPNLPERETWELMKPFLETQPIVAHNLNFERHNARLLDAKDRGPSININGVGDTIIYAYVLSEWKSVGLKSLTKERYGHQMIELMSLFEGILKKDEKAIRFNTLELNPKVVTYGCEDAYWCLRHYHDLVKKAETERKFITQLEHRVQPVVLDMEDAAVLIDWDAMEMSYATAKKFAVKMRERVREMFSEAVGRDLSKLNFNSAPQMRKLLYDPPSEGGLGLITKRTTGKGEMSTDAVALKTLSLSVPAIKKLLEYREVMNLHNRHKGWLTDFKPFTADGRIHASYNQTLVPSGRFAAGNPAIQQLPKEWRWSLATGDVMDDEFWNDVVDTGVNGEDYWAGNFRDFIVSAPKHYLLQFDLSQAELRVVAGLAQEESLLKAFREGTDIHKFTASLMLNVSYEKVQKWQRNIGKTLGFALVYQLSISGLAERLGVSFDEAERLFNRYFEVFPAIKRWMDKTVQRGHESGYVETPMGRKATVWELWSENKSVRKKADRIMGNIPCQGGAADYMKVSMIKCANTLQKAGLWHGKVKMIMNQHDSLVFEVSEDINPNELIKLLQASAEFSIGDKFPPFKADWEIGYKWGSTQEVPEDVELVFVDNKWIVPKKEKKAKVEALKLLSVVTPSASLTEKFIRLVESRPGNVRIVVNDCPTEYFTDLGEDDTVVIKALLATESIEFKEVENASI